MPDTYISQFSGEEIDSALRAAQMISGASTPAELREKLEIRGDTIPVSAGDSTLISEALTKIPTTSGGGVNPNLLDNWYFGRPVNQRGQTEYTGNAACTIDRWWTQYEITLSIVDGGIKIGGKWDVQQYFETTLPNATYTLSLLYKDRTGSDPLRLLIGNRTDGDLAQTESKDASGILSVTFSTAKLNKVNFGFTGSTDNSATIIAIKLELGDTQTLAHKENGVWVLNEIPDFREQLARCQRYCVAFKQYDAFFPDGETDFIVELPRPMRTSPTIINPENITNVTNPTMVWYNVGSNQLRIRSTTTLSNNARAVCSGLVLFSADL
jgi:hypothetical protein|nr:MAG TPA: hypothetical protein [Caudoviricetes sp.]